MKIKIYVDYKTRKEILSEREYQEKIQSWCSWFSGPNMRDRSYLHKWKVSYLDLLGELPCMEDEKVKKKYTEWCKRKVEEWLKNQWEECELEV